MDEIILEIHFNKKKMKIPHTKGESLEIPFRHFTDSQKMKLENFVFLYKTSIINYKSAKSSSKDMNNFFFKDKEQNSFRIFAYLIDSEENKKNAWQQSEELNLEQNKKQNNETKNEKVEETKKIKYYNDIICPECETSAIIDVLDGDKVTDLLNFNIYNCDNFHYLQNNKFNIYDDYYCRFADKCNHCNFSQVQLTPPEDKLFLCSCGDKLCPDCNRSHIEPGHKKIFYNDKNYYCIKHEKKYSSYCIDCNTNYCDDCKESHVNHECFEYKTLKPRAEDITKFKEKVEEQKTHLKNFMDYYKKTFDDWTKTVESYLNSYILIEEALLSRYKDNFLNFQLLRNLNNDKIFNIPLFNNLEKRINSAEGSIEKFKYLRDLYRIITKKKGNITNIKRDPKDNNIIQLKYKINDVKSIHKYIKLFDPVFVKNNKDKLSIEINNEKQNELSAYFENKNKNNKNKNDEQEINVILKENKENAVRNMSYMLNNCKNLVSVDLSRFNTKNIISTEAMFQMCPLKDIPSIISKLSFPNLINVRAMFCKCLNIKTIPDLCNIFNKTNKISDISMLFNGCKNLKEIINFNKWYLPNITDMSYLFNRCKEIATINFGKITSENIINMCGLFNCCEKLSSIKQMVWKTNNVEDMSIMFQRCINLYRLDDIHKFNTKNVKDMSGIFSNCNHLMVIPKIGNWNINNVRKIVGLFNECHGLEKIPDLGSWNMSHIKDASGMFYNCKYLTEVKGIRNWRFDNGAIIDKIFDRCSLPNTDDIIKAWKEKE